ncbi:hypothetical protein ACPPVO_52105 [Dactylosporangium sp. McL0621]|uniref:hypothetical protein n=1 Tax=Dactylosporangium sp. McL0621 TaxID=3415678 RepID=UPI003CEFB101
MSQHEVRALLLRATEDRPPGLDLVAGLPAVRRRAPARALVPLVALGVAAAAIVSVLLLALPLGEPSAQAQVAAAVENIDQQSYRLHGTGGDGRAFEGAFDPARRVGVITVPGEDRETRFIGDLMYVREQGATTWTAYPRTGLDTAPVAVALVKLGPLDTQALLRRLRSATDVREAGSASGDGWTGKRFTFVVVDKAEAKQPEGRSETLTGAVDVDDQGRVRRLQVGFDTSGRREVMEFGDFGTPVTVTAPPAADVDRSPTEKHVKTTDKPTGTPAEEAPNGKPTSKNR